MKKLFAPAALPVSATALALIFGLGLSVSPQAAQAAESGGLKVKSSVPRFLLPVVNKDAFTESRKWGPNRWVGRSAKQKKKLLIMSFFATYCEPCKKEMPELVRLYQEYGDQGLGVMLVSIDKGRSTRDELRQLAKANKVPFPVVHDAFQVVARRYKAERLPYMLMVGPDGRVKAVHVGYTEEMKHGLENEVRAHLGLPPVKKASARDLVKAEASPARGEVAKADEGEVDKKKRSKRRKRKARRGDEG